MIILRTFKIEIECKVHCALVYVELGYFGGGILHNCNYGSLAKSLQALTSQDTSGAGHRRRDRSRPPQAFQYRFEHVCKSLKWMPS